MSAPRSWPFFLVGFVCFVLAVLGVLVYLPPSWGIIEVALYLGFVTLGLTGILRLIYLKGLPD
ncbi:MAG: hypothetical protein ACFFF9_02370 [Candidatus Thorarchaeota archaeon]